MGGEAAYEFGCGLCAKWDSSTFYFTLALKIQFNFCYFYDAEILTTYLSLFGTSLFEGLLKVTSFAGLK